MQIRILLAEDEQPVAELFGRILEPITSRMVIVATLSECIDAARNEKFDVVLLDLTLKDSGRDETLNAIPKLKGINHAPIIVVTGSSEQNIRERSLAAGADYFVEKTEAAAVHTPLLMAIKAATVAHPQGDPTESFSAHVEMLERLCST